MSLLFVMLTSLWIEFGEHKTEIFCFFSPTEGKEFLVNLIDDDVWESEYEQTGALNGEVENWD